MVREAPAVRPGTLYVVATPIGNLEDVTLRALRVLRSVDLIAAEDTRRTAALLTHHGIRTRSVSFHAHNARRRTPSLIRQLQSDKSIALVTDAGTPAVSDPGAELVTAAVEAGVRVEPVPGPSAPLAALVASGFQALALAILGFPPVRLKDRKDWLNDLCMTDKTAIFFEAPHRIRQTLTLAATVLGKRQICVGREMTKVHEEFLRGTCAEVLARLTEARGEFTIVVAPGANPEQTERSVPTDAEIFEKFGLMTESEGFGRREAISAVARKLGCGSRDVYAAIERHKLTLLAADNPP